MGDTCIIHATLYEGGRNSYVENEHYAVIDQHLVWHGGINLLGKEDVWDNLIRVDNAQAAAELMEISEMTVSESE